MKGFFAAFLMMGTLLLSSSAAAAQSESALLHSAGFLPDEASGDRVYVLPGGQSVGVQLESDGLYVTGFHYMNVNGQNVSPAEAAGILPGDVIMKAGSKKAAVTDVKALAESAGQTQEAVRFQVKRGSRLLDVDVKPEKDEEKGTFQFGLAIKLHTAGIGTLTFVEPKTGAFGALGHVISDSKTGKPFAPITGTLHPAAITGIRKATPGVPGEKLAERLSPEKWGMISKNTPYGLYGTFSNKLTGEQLYPVAHPDEVALGKAEIRTVTEGSKVESFAIEIVEKTDQKKPALKGMVIRLTDARLLEKTGGIVQGMSGSPIIQNGRIIGAVTHVFVNDPVSGYAVYMDWMLKEAGLL